MKVVPETAGKVYVSPETSLESMNSLKWLWRLILLLMSLLSRLGRSMFACRRVGFVVVIIE